MDVYSLAIGSTVAGTSAVNTALMQTGSVAMNVETSSNTAFAPTEQAVADMSAAIQ
jgi:hypothetical protein